MNWNRTTLKFYLGSLAAIPLLPLLYFQGKRVIQKIPLLPPAVGPLGSVSNRGGEPFHLLAIGESTVAGVGSPTHEVAFTGTLAKFISAQLDRPVAWQVFAESGFTTQRMVDEILPRISGVEADLIVVGTGGNDAFKLTKPTEFSRQISRLVHRLREHYPSVPIAFLNVPPIKEFPAFTRLLKASIGGLVELHGEALERVIRNYDNVYYNPEKIRMLMWQHRYDIAGVAEDFFSDGVHPSTLTYQVWARDFGEWLLTTAALSDRKL
ncbi:SGNH/GDSL hydrolase family protein [Neolewinella antarctica]|uniref:Lysophospholipase L1-like esterase n=1 Tax=Neolewinella antarctica TaxID=442734 RepID=A0ABX0XB63_9BACT|nr:SGNH/GDSL hydrolase family protein [Neolewinella antarctica]NJC26513.1 lysophospholipase L1-like esterase [Neolewinella antarctica]